MTVPVVKMDTKWLGTGGSPAQAVAGPRPRLRDGAASAGPTGAALGDENVSFAGAFTDADVALLESAAALLSPFLLALGRIDHALDEVARLRATPGAAPGANELIGESAAVRKLRALIEKVADSGAPVLIEGESGTGKELVARALHRRSSRRDAPFVAVNCAAIPEGLLESELFGHEKGAFTGATERRKGRFEQADRGTMFLDEIGEMRPDLQAKLLRVLQDQTFERVGGNTPLRVDVRVVAATHRDVKKLVAEGRFREDLFYRIHVVPLAVPPLRDRADDIPLLARHFLEDASRSLGRPLSFEAPALQVLSRHAFPGNVRELKNLVLRMAVLADGSTLGVADVPDDVGGPRTATLDKDPLRRFLRSDATPAPSLRCKRSGPISRGRFSKSSAAIRAIMHAPRESRVSRARPLGTGREQRAVWLLNGARRGGSVFQVSHPEAWRVNYDARDRRCRRPTTGDSPWASGASNCGTSGSSSCGWDWAWESPRTATRSSSRIACRPSWTP